MYYVKNKPRPDIKYEGDILKELTIPRRQDSYFVNSLKDKIKTELYYHLDKQFRLAMDSLLSNSLLILQNAGSDGDNTELIFLTHGLRIVGSSLYNILYAKHNLEDNPNIWIEHETDKCKIFLDFYIEDNNIKVKFNNVLFTGVKLNDDRVREYNVLLYSELRHLPYNYYGDLEFSKKFLYKIKDVIYEYLPDMLL